MKINDLKAISEFGDVLYKKVKFNSKSSRIVKVFKELNISANKILEIGCGRGKTLFKLKQKIKNSKLTGIDVSKEAIIYCKKNYKNVNFYNLDSLKILKLKSSFDVIILGYFLYLLPRERLFEQFDLITKKLNKNGIIIINDFKTNYPCYNFNISNKKILSFKTDYEQFLTCSNNYELIYKKEIIHKQYIAKYKNPNSLISAYRKINFLDRFSKDLIE
jgi:SAM-dependent methyltransferase